MRHLWILVSAFILIGLVSCEREKADTDAGVKYVYSSETLDSMASQIRQSLIDQNVKSYTTSTCLTQYMQAFQSLEYQDYDGAIPSYKFTLDTTSIYSPRQFRTIVVNGNRVTDCNIMYVHGGAWTYQIDPAHFKFTEDIAGRMNASVYVPLYPMLPRWNSTDAFEMLLEVYSMLLQQGKPILLIGDSAGGNMIFGFTFYLKTLGYSLPSYLVGLSPAVDMSGSNPEIEAYDALDVYIDKTCFQAVAKPWADGKPLTDPTISPLYGDPTGFPPVLIYIGDHEILYPDVIRFAENCALKGVRTTVFVGRGLWHVATLSDIPFAAQFKDYLVSSVK